MGTRSSDEAGLLRLRLVLEQRELCEDLILAAGARREPGPDQHLELRVLAAEVSRLMIDIWVGHVMVYFNMVLQDCFGRYS